ncbi:hypothetical protein M0805_003932 [Coniferiporia weirii]|nr:hypothetical protein M0805_003932 [Coniferiporia weirii]
MSPATNYNSQTGADIEAARRSVKLDVAAVRAFLHGGESLWRVHQRISEILSSDPVFDKSQRYYITRKEAYKRALSMQKRIEELRQTHKWNVKDMSFAQLALDEPMPMDLHITAFEPVVMSQGSPELVATFGPLIASRGIIGCYLQTELGHGTNVAQLETTATYLPESEEFDIHSPTLTSTKWWIGCLGKTATHGVVQARLILPSGKDFGPHLFLVQLRSLDDHEVLPRIQIGDIGPKAMAGYSGVDNGYARFDHLRVPRSQMLSKFSQVTKDGEYVKPPHAKLSYGGMLYIRSGMVTTAGRTLAKASTISIRYATVRRQGNKLEGGLEHQIITYPSVHYRLLPILSRAYVYILLGRNLTNSFVELSAQLSRKDTSHLGEMHAITSGLKMLATTTTLEDVEVARRSMGGHGYSAYAALGLVYANALPSATYEGDNFVLDQQVVRAALKACNDLTATKLSSPVPLSPFNAYLRHLQKADTESQKRPYEAPLWTDWHVPILVLELRAARAVEERFIAQALEEVDASSDHRVSRAVTEAYVAVQVGEMIRTLPLSEESASIVKTLLKLYLLSTVETAMADILSFNIISSRLTGRGREPLKALRLEIASLCAELLPEAISLTDAFGYSDWELDSALGVYNGRVYEALWLRAQTEPLNQTDVTDEYKEFIRPLPEHGKKIAVSGLPIKSKL